MTSTPYAFYLPENPSFTILDSAIASAQFGYSACDDPGDGTLRCQSITALQNGELERLRGRLIEGVGYCADAVFAAHWLERLGRVINNPQLRQVGRRIGLHTLAEGFFDDPDIPIRLYRDVESGEFLNNLEVRPGYIELGHIGRVAHELAQWHDLLEDKQLEERVRAIVIRTARWLIEAERCANGWYPRRSTPDRRVYRLATDAFGPASIDEEAPPTDPVFDRSATGTLIVQLLADVSRRGWLDAKDTLQSDTTAFVNGGGFFGSINTDTEDAQENVAYAMAFQAMHAAAQVLQEPSLTEFAYEVCLGGLRQFEMTTDVNGLETKGLLWMEPSWNSACMWEIAEAAQAYLVAYGETRDRTHVMKALTMLRGMAKHHHGPLGMLTEAVDWDGHSVVTRHFDGQRYSDIRETHPFLNNLHVLEPTVTYLERFALRAPGGDGVGSAFYDLERNRLGPTEVGILSWLPT